MDFRTVHTQVWDSLRDVYHYDRGLLAKPPHAPQGVPLRRRPGTNSVPEQALAFRFAHYLSGRVDALPEDPGGTERYVVDCEYRRAGDLVKSFLIVDNCLAAVTNRGHQKAARVAPDVIVHRRAVDGPVANLLAVECKAATGGPTRSTHAGLVGRKVDQDDHARLMLFTGCANPNNVEYKNGEFVLRPRRDLERPARTEWLDRALPNPYLYGASILFTPGGVRVSWYKHAGPERQFVQVAAVPDVGPFTCDYGEDIQQWAG